MNIFSRLKTLKTASAFADAVPDLERELAAAEVTVQQLEEKREATLFGDGDIAALQAKINAAKDEAANLKIALEGARRRQASAAAAERQAEIEARQRRVKETLVPRLRKNLMRFHTLATELAEVSEAIFQDEAALREANAAVSADGRRDLEIESIYQEIWEKRQAAFVAHYQGKGQPLPINGQIDMAGSPLTELSIRHYWPRPQIDAGKAYLAPPLSFLK